ncbi:hypothetical protein B9Z65_6363 [Elsinoe australis]|uniref:Uncharacterized protein n=1 Tax=Elsinoe australis TaxID=40998 RepID=A0A2P8A8E9_9PEZI|nr:hypothetical protein B9Z65_6363 [Elsinoe australis]
MADSASVSSASTRLTSTTTIMSTLFLTQTVTIPNPTGTASLSTTLVPTSTDTTELKPSQTYLPPAYHLDPNTKEAIAPGPISHKAAIAGGVTGSISAVAAIGIVAFFFWKRRRTPTEVTEEKSEREKAYMPRKSIDRKERRSFVQL